MGHLKKFPRFLLNLPAPLRLWIVIFSTVGSQILFILLAPIEQNPCILAIPIVVAAWFYQKRGMWLSLAVVVITTWIFYVVRSRHHTFSNSFLIDFGIGVLALLIIGLFISARRELFEQTEMSKRQLAKAYDEEQRLHQAKHQFIQNVNHELRTPLTTLSGCLDLLLDQNEHFDTETRARFLQSALSSCEELQLLVNNILECLQVSNNQAVIWPQESAVASIIQEIVRLSDPTWQLAKRVQLKIAEDLVVLAHTRYLRHLLYNLLSNAVKYTPGEQPILISARRVDNLSTAQPEICISVKDWGPGIPPDEIQQLFGQFVRLRRDALGQIRGSGLGLYICKQLVEAMGGHIWVESAGIPGEGSCFSFVLPAAVARHTDAQPVLQNISLAESTV